VNEDVLIVAGFIALLKDAVITAMFGQATVVPISGVTDTTVGGDNGVPGAAALSGSPQLVNTTASRNTEIKILLIFDLLKMNTSLLHTVHWLIVPG